MLRRQFLALLTAAAARLPARAESLPVIGFMSGRAPEDSDYLVMAFRDGLKEAGYEDGRNVAIELSTHAIGGQSENDFILAAKIDQVPIELKQSKSK